MKRKQIFMLFFMPLSVFIAWWFGVSGVAESFASTLFPWPGIAAFLAGIGFTSLFTVAPSVILLGSLSSSWGLLPTVIVGSVGAVVGDVILLKVMVSVTKTVDMSIGGVALVPRFIRLRRLQETFSHGPLRFVLWITGAIILASPFPDELGLAMMGISRIPLRILVVVCLLFNAAGILGVALVARAL